MKTRNYQRSLVNNWNDINWNKAESNLADLQYEILKAHESDMEKEWCYNLISSWICIGWLKPYAVKVARTV